jgi:hypothetical protein
MIPADKPVDLRVIVQSPTELTSIIANPIRNEEADGKTFSRYPGYCVRTEKLPDLAKLEIVTL